MMTRCCVPFCNEPGGHRFPKDTKIRKLWLKSIRCENLVPNDGTRLCRQHFTDDDYIKTSIHTGSKHQYNYLQKYAVPSIFPWTESERYNIGKQMAGTHNGPTINSSKEVTRSEEKTRTSTTIMCAVPQCNSTNTTVGVTFHPLPKNNTLRKKWTEILNVDITKNMKVCSLHFNQDDFVTQDGSGETRSLKQNALPIQKQTEVLVPKVEHQKTETLNGLDTMGDTAEPSADSEDGPVAVCRACLRNCGRVNALCDIFQAWSPPWPGMEPTIAGDLAKLVNIEITPSDLLPKSMCHTCYQELLNAATFVSKVRYCNSVLKQRYNWPKPIRIDKNINGSVYERSMDVDIKQEVLSDEEYGNASEAYMESSAGLDIKEEPEEIEEPPPMQITINGTMSLNPNTNNPLINGIVKDGEQHLEVVVKQEPLSAEEDDEVVHDLPLECMLCAKSFNKVSGLKAHVIAEHSYKSVKRKSSSRPSPEKKQKHANKCICQICKRSFTTQTDLMVHETCHNMFSCYSCYTLFDSFEKLSKHRMMRCKASHNSNVQRLKTLDDVMRPQLANSNHHSPTLDTGPVPQNHPVLVINPVSTRNAVSGTHVVLEISSMSNTNTVSDTNIVSNSNRASEINPVSDIKPVFDTNHVLDGNLVSGTDTVSNQVLDTISDTKQVSETDPVLDITPIPDASLVSETKPESHIIQDSDINPVTDTNPVLDTKPVLEANLVSEVNPVSDTKPVSEDNPVSETKPVSENNPVSETKPVSEANPVSDIKPFSEANPVSDTKPGLEANQVSDIKPVSEGNLVSDIKPVSEANLVSDTKPVLDTNLASETHPVLDTNSVKDIQTEVALNSRIDNSDDDTSDSSMKLHLEIHSAKQEAAPIAISDVDVQDSVEMELRSLHEDDK